VTNTPFLIGGVRSILARVLDCHNIVQHFGVVGTTHAGNVSMMTIVIACILEEHTNAQRIQNGNA
jgi:hypothetical protein